MAHVTTLRDSPAGGESSKPNRPQAPWTHSASATPGYRVLSATCQMSMLPSPPTWSDIQNNVDPSVVGMDLPWNPVLLGSGPTLVGAPNGFSTLVLVATHTCHIERHGPGTATSLVRKVPG